MKKRWILLILPLMMMVMPVATANGWGLPEALVPLVSNTNDYDDYYHLADDYARKENSARIIMQSRYHNQLIAAEKGADGWKSVVVSTTAVYQPSEGHGVPTLARTEDGFELAYPEAGEVYRFALRHDSLVENGHAGGLQYPPNAPRHSRCSADERNGLRLAALCKCAEGRCQGNPSRMAACADSDGVRHLSHG